MTSRTTRASRRDDESGFVAIFFVLCLSAFMIGVAALAVDVGRWYVEVQRVQRAADAGALAGVEYLPQDLTTASSTAKTSATVNGYTNGVNNATVAVGLGSKTSQLKVTVCGYVPSIFGSLAGISSTTICRAAVADFTGPAPLGSPCNTFANEPAGGGGTASPTPAGTAQASQPYGNCKSNPQMWADIEGPQTSKEQGDRFQTLNCDNGTSTDGCTSGSTNNNSDYDVAGYFWLVHIEPAAVNQTVDLQLFDPAFVNTGQTCAATSMPTPAFTANSPNDYVTDAKNRYTVNSYSTATSTGAPTCPGDSFPGSSGTPAAMVTSFALRQQTDTLNPLTAAVQTSTSGLSCVKQYAGFSSRLSANALTKGASGYVDGLAAEFHNWVSFCKFTPTRAGDYYLQVRSDVSLGAATSTDGGVTYTGNDTAVLNSSAATMTTGEGANGFSIRAVTAAGLQNSVSVSAYDKMPIFVNATGSSAQFNLIRVLPGAAGKSISFTFYDVGDAAGSGTVTVSMPTDATNSSGTAYSTAATRFPGGCKAVGAGAGTGSTLTGCSAPISSSDNNGKLETVSIPIPTDYTCNYSSLGGCWYQVTEAFGSNVAVHDTTTWTADIVGQPVRLIQ